MEVSNDLTLPLINKLVIVQFLKGPNVKSLLMRHPKFCMLLQVPLQHFLHYKVISANVRLGLKALDKGFLL
jgi:hypothetical protein